MCCGRFGGRILVCYIDYRTWMRERKLCLFCVIDLYKLLYESLETLGAHRIPVPRVS